MSGYLSSLEAESIEILREAIAVAENPVMMYSIGKDSSVMLHLARSYKGRITTWIVWNEPDFLPGESGTWWTWSGNTADFYRLLKTAYRAIKQVDPSATVVFPATTYFADAVHGRELFLGRVLQTRPQLCTRVARRNF